MWRKTLQFELAHFGPSSNESTLALAGLASSEYRAGDWAQAHRHFTQALALYTRHGGQPQLTQVYAAQKACVLEGLRADRAAAQARCRQAQAWSADGFGETSALHGDSLEATAFGLEEAGDLAGARELFAAARQRYGDSPANRMRVGRIDSELAGIDLLEGHPEQARTLLPAAIAGLRTRSWPMPPLIAEARLLLACTEAPGAGCPDDLQASVDRDVAAAASRHDPQLLWVHTLRARVELLRGEPELARTELATAMANAARELPPAHPRQLAAQLWLAIATARTGDCAAASARARAASTIIEANRLAAHPGLAGPQAMLRQPIATCVALPN